MCYNGGIRIEKNNHCSNNNLLLERTQASEQMLRSCFIYFAQAVNKLTGGNGYG